MSKQNAYNGIFTKKMVSDENVSFDLSQSIIVTTEDKLRLKLQTYLTSVEKTKEWIAPFSLLVSLSLSLVTADFKTLFFSAEMWNAFFLIATMISAGWLIFSLRQAFKSYSLDFLIEQIKSGTKGLNDPEGGPNVNKS